MTQEAPNPAYLWWNHELRKWDDCTVHLTENWWASTGAVFEGIRGYWNDTSQDVCIFRLDEHLQRLENSMRLTRMDESFPAEELKRAILELVRANDHRGDVYIMPLAYASGGKTFGGSTERSTNLFIYSRPRSSTLLEDVAVTAGFSSWTRINERVMPPRAKSISNYRNSQLASYEASMNGYDYAIMLNPEGKISEGPGACLFLVRDGKLITPDFASGILESITRDAIVRIGRDLLGLEVEERVVDRTEAYLADEAFFCGTAMEVAPIVSIDHYDVRQGAPGPVTRRIRELFRGLVRGTDSRYPEWRTPVGMRSGDLTGLPAER